LLSRTSRSCMTNRSYTGQNPVLSRKSKRSTLKVSVQPVRAAQRARRACDWQWPRDRLQAA
jgi:hypothetical protein